MASGHHAHPRFPPWLAFMLTRRRRRREYPPEAIAARIGVGPTDVVMDFGCGPGFFTEAFAGRAARVIAVDIEPGMLKKARKRLGAVAARVDFIVTADGARLDIPTASVDLVFLAYVYHELAEPARVLSEFARTLRPGGRLVIMERTQGVPSGFRAPVVDPDSVEKEVQLAGFAPRDRIRWSESTLLEFERARP